MQCYILEDVLQDKKETGIADATEKLLKLADVDYHILDDEKCCGSVLLRTGFEKEAKNK